MWILSRGCVDHVDLMKGKLTWRINRHDLPYPLGPKKNDSVAFTKQSRCTKGCRSLVTARQTENKARWLPTSKVTPLVTVQDVSQADVSLSRRAALPWPSECGMLPGRWPMFSRLLFPGLEVRRNYIRTMPGLCVGSEWWTYRCGFSTGFGDHRIRRALLLSLLFVLPSAWEMQETRV